MLIRYKKILLLTFFSIFLFGHGVNAQITKWKDNVNTVGGGTPYNDKQGTSFTSADLAEFIGKIIWIGPFLGILFMIHMVLAGYEWMTAAGDAKKVEDAKKRITNAVIGLVLFTGLFVIAYFVIQSLAEVTEYVP